MDEAMGRVGVSAEDIRVRSYEEFRREFCFEPPESVARRFREHQETVCRNMELVRRELAAERAPRLPRPPEALLEIVDAPHRRQARQREGERAEHAAVRKAEADRIAAEAAERKRAAVATENHRQVLLQDILSEVNAERAAQRAMRDEAIREQRRKLLARPPPPPSPTDTTRSQGTLAAASPRASLVDARLARALLRREEVDEARRAVFAARQSVEEKREYEHAVNQAVEHERRSTHAARRSLHCQEVAQRAVDEAAKNANLLTHRSELSASRGREQLATNAERRQSTIVEYTQARATCMENAAAFRAAKAKSLFERMVTKDAAEKARLTAFLVESENVRAQRVEERERKFHKIEELLQQRKRGNDYRARELLAEGAARQEAATVRRQILQEAPYV